MRALHFSDIHLQQPLQGVPLLEWLGKRAFGGANLLLGRRHRFTEAAAKVAALDRFRRQLEIDLVLFSGDYTALGTKAELQAAKVAVEPLTDAPAGFLHLPGNHDVYCLRSQREERFWQVFHEPTPQDLSGYTASSSRWPMVRLIDEDTAVVAVDSVRANPLPWRSSGRIPEDQLTALATVLAKPQLRQRFVFIMTHYAPRLADGNADRKHHGLENAEDFLEICSQVSRGAILCGHIHHAYCVYEVGVGIPIFCGGSATYAGRESIWVYDIQPHAASATPGRWRDGGYELVDDQTIQWTTND